MGFLPGPRFDFDRAARLTARLVEVLGMQSPPAGTLLNVNCPTGEPVGVEITRLGKRIYEDELRLVDEDGSGRRRYRIYGFAPSFEEEPGTDLTAVAARRVSITPVHFDLTDHEGVDRLRAAELEGELAAALEATIEAGPGAGA